LPDNKFSTKEEYAGYIAALYSLPLDKIKMEEIIKCTDDCDYIHCRGYFYKGLINMGAG
jgi:hypothetical protein